ncbi:putative signal peptide protein, partial [Puccinia sorghi]
MKEPCCGTSIWLGLWVMGISHVVSRLGFTHLCYEPSALSRGQSIKDSQSIKKAIDISKSLVPVENSLDASIMDTLSNPITSGNDSTPQIKLCTEKLNDSNFLAWRYDMRNALGFMNLNDYIKEHTAELKQH